MSARNHSRKTIQQGQPTPGVPNSITIVTCRVDLPEHIYDAYAAIAVRTNIEIEDILQQQLLRCRDIIGSGIYFNESQKKRLSNVVGHTVADAEGALQRLETSTVIDVSGFKFELDPRLVQRLKTRVFRGESYEDVMYREIVRALMTFAGMNPPLSNSGGWWRRHGTNGKVTPAASTTAAKEAPNGQDRNLILPGGVPARDPA